MVDCFCTNFIGLLTISSYDLGIHAVGDYFDEKSCEWKLYDRE